VDCITAPALRARHTKEQGTSTSDSAARYRFLMRDIRKSQKSHLSDAAALLVSALAAIQPHWYDELSLV